MIQNKFKNYITNNSNRWDQLFKIVFVLFTNITKECFHMFHVIHILKKLSKELEIKVIKWAFGRQEMAYKTITNFYECSFIYT